MFSNDPDDRPDYFLADEQESTPAASATQDNSIDFLPDTGNTTEETHLRKPHHPFRRVIGWTIAIGIIALGASFYLRYCSPYAVDAIERVYIVNVDKRGLVFKTYEAQVVPLASLADTSSIYSPTQQFTVASAELAAKMQQFQGTRTPVTLHYEKFYATLPWRGASKSVVSSITTE